VPVHLKLTCAGFHLLTGRVTIGEYDGEHPCLTAATIGDKVIQLQRQPSY